MENKKVLLIAGVVAIVVASVFTYFRPANVVVKEIKEIVREQLGAVAGPEDSNDYHCLNGVCEYVRTGQCLDATTTLFSILNPVGATSTIAFIEYWGNSGTTSLGVVMSTSSISTVAANRFDVNVWATTSIATSTEYYRSGPGLGFDSASKVAPPQDLPATSTIFSSIGPTEYLIAKATSSNMGALDGGLLGANNAFTCEYRVKFIR